MTPDGFFSCRERTFGLDHRFGHSEPRLLGSGVVPVVYARASDWNFGRNDYQGRTFDGIRLNISIIHTFLCVTSLLCGEGIESAEAERLGANYSVL